MTAFNSLLRQKFILSREVWAEECPGSLRHRERQGLARLRITLCCLSLSMSSCAEPQACAPGATQQCACKEGTSGAQACAATGKTWEACECAAPVAEVERVCVTGATQACSCSSGASGAQSCASDGNAWSPCECDETRQPARRAKKAEDEPALANLAAEAVTDGPTPYLVRISAAQLANTKPNGSAWDGTGDGLPDPYVNLRVQGPSTSESMQTEPVQDTLSPRWTKVQRMNLSRGDTLVVGIIDADALASDDIASFTRDFTGAKRYRFSAPGSSLISLDVDIEAAPM